jgi:hypothetical protein
VRGILRACDFRVEMLESSGNGALVNVAGDSRAQLLDGWDKRSYRRQQSRKVCWSLRGGVCLKERVARDEIFDSSLL